MDQFDVLKKERGLSFDFLRVAADLTPRQRDQLQHYKERGQVACYRNGRLHVENRRRDYTDSHPQRQNSAQERRDGLLPRGEKTGHMSNVKIISTTSTMIDEPTATTSSDIAKADTMTSNTTLILKTGIVDGTRQTDMVDFMIQTHHSTSTYPTIPEDNGMELHNTES